MKHKVFFLLIVLVGILLRVWKLGDIPYGFFADEASIGYNAYTILTNGKDEFDNVYPIFFRAFGEYKNPVQIYSTVPFIFLFGLNEFSVRLPSAIWGMATLVIIYFLTEKIFCKKERRALNVERREESTHNAQRTTHIALISALLLAISPWHIHFSRTSLEGLMPFVFFFTLGTYLFLKALKNPRRIYFSAIAFIMATYSYFPARLFIPLFGMGLFILHLKFFVSQPRVTIKVALLSLILLLPLMVHTGSGAGLSRWRQVTVFGQAKTAKETSNHISANYLRHFSADFLFLKGDIDMPGQFITRHSVRGIGELYLFQMPLVISGLIFLILKEKWKVLAILSWWLFLYPLGSMFTADASPQATRSIIGVVPWQIISAIGFVWLMAFIKTGLPKIIKGIVLLSSALIIAGSITNFVYLYFYQYPKYSSNYWGWQAGPRQIISYFQQIQADYDQLYLTGNFNGAHVFLKFYDPRSQCPKCKIGGLDKRDNRFRQIFALRPEEIRNYSFESYRIIRTIEYPNGSEAFRLISFEKS